MEPRPTSDRIPLHIGDTYRLPPDSALRIDFRRGPLHRLGHVEGEPVLRQAIARHFHDRHGFPVEGDRVFMTAGATGGLAIATEALFDPGDEVILLTPTWPVMFGILERRGVQIREVPIGADGWPEHDPAPLHARLESAITPRTAGIYFCDPNNPTGSVLPKTAQDLLAEVINAHSLWAILDITYCDLVFDPAEYTLAAMRPDLRDRCILVGTFSKCFALAGHRTGYLIAPDSLRRHIPPLITHTIYHTSRVGQAMALACLDSSGCFDDMLDSYRCGLTTVRTHLQAPFRVPRGGGFVLLDLRPLGIDDPVYAERFLRDCADAGVMLAPGTIFGSDFVAFARLCYTIVPPDILEQALHSINRVVERHH